MENAGSRLGIGEPLKDMMMEWIHIPQTGEVADGHHPVPDFSPSKSSYTISIFNDSPESRLRLKHVVNNPSVFVFLLEMLLPSEVIAKSYPAYDGTHPVIITQCMDMLRIE